MKRVGIIAIQHESNTFLDRPTDLEAFKRGAFLRGEEVRREYRNAHHEIGGFFEGLEAAGIEAVPLLMAYAVPNGMVTGDALKALWATACEEIDAAGKIDGWLLAPHGAGVCEAERDMDGWWLTELRKRVGRDAPMVCTLDPHANVSQRMIDACDATITYRENPHLDQRARGLEAAGLIVRHLRGEVKLTQAASLPPIAINIERQLTSDYPALALQEQAERVRGLPGVLSVSVILGFPYADVAEMGSGFIVVTDGSKESAERYAAELGRWLYDHREDYRGELISIEEAVDRVATSPQPVGLLDMGDNVGGGGPADGTLIAHALRERVSGRKLVVMTDPESAAAARDAGVGARLRLRMGGKITTNQGAPIEEEVTVVSLHDGVFRETQPRHGGKTVYNMGPSAVVETDDGLTALLMTLRCGPMSLQQLLVAGIDPAKYAAIVIKGVHAPVAAYREVCPTLIRVNTPGTTTADMELLSFRYRRRPMFPFEEISAV